MHTRLVARSLVSSLVVGFAVTAVPPVGGQTVGMTPRRNQEVSYVVLRADSPFPLVLSRSVTVRETNAPLDRVVNAIARQAGFDVVFEPGTAAGTRRVSVEQVDVAAAKALLEVLRASGLVARSARDGRIVRVGFAGRARGGSQGGTITGRITDSAGRGIPGAEIFLDRTRWRTVTDTVGWYRLAELEPGGYTIVARRLGYARQSRRVQVATEREDTVHMVLAPVAVSLNELVTTATGQQRRRDIGNAVTTIRADSVLRSAPIRNLTDLLTNRVPGLTTRHTTGAPGDPARLRLRGLGSALRSNDPVVIVDGVRVYAAQAEARSGNLTNGVTGADAIGRGVPAPSPLDQIDPNIIETIEVFKGPSAATLYGADAANGVIVITTKRGKPGPTRWNAKVEHGRTTQPGRYPTGYYRWGRDLLDDKSRFCL